MSGTEKPDPDQLVSDQTREAEREEASAAHQPDRPPTAEEADDAPTEVDRKVAENIERMDKLGAQVKGEGQIP
jgi:hypothetical protein